MSEPRVWLIWSKYHRAWHRRGSDGEPRGYAPHISEAGFFEQSKAAAYNDERDRPIQSWGRKAKFMALDELTRLERDRRIIDARIDVCRALIASKPVHESIPA